MSMISYSLFTAFTLSLFHYADDERQKDTMNIIRSSPSSFILSSKPTCQVRGNSHKRAQAAVKAPGPVKRDQVTEEQEQSVSCAVQPAGFDTFLLYMTGFYASRERLRGEGRGFYNT